MYFYKTADNKGLLKTKSKIENNDYIEISEEEYNNLLAEMEQNNG